MDKRLSALAAKFGGHYTRYADDLTFSGFQDMASHAGRLLAIVRKVVRSEGFELNEKKTRVMRKGRQQRVTGVVVNEGTNVSRHEFDNLKALLTNCIRHGPATQNRENHPDFRGHLQGRVAHALHIGPRRGAKLKALLDRIQWP
jgi:retron-type reverse transcriptase